MKQKYSVKQLAELKPIDIRKMTDTELRQSITIMNSAVNKRIRRIYESDLDPRLVPSIRKASETLGVDLETGEIPKYTLPRGKIDRTTLLNKFRSVREFLGYKTSNLSSGYTVEIDEVTGEKHRHATGAKGYQEILEELVGEEIANDVDLQNEFWAGYNRFVNESILHTYGSEQIIAWIREQVNNGRVFADRESIYEALRQQYENEELGDERFTRPYTGISLTEEDLDGR